MNKGALLRIGIIVFVITGAFTLIYNYFLISPRYLGVDQFGIKEIYPTKTGGEEWFMNMDDPGNDPRIGGEGPSSIFALQNDDGSWKVHSTEVRYGVLTSSGYHHDLITTLNDYYFQPNSIKSQIRQQSFNIFSLSTGNLMEIRSMVWSKIRTTCRTIGMEL